MSTRYVLMYIRKKCLYFIILCLSFMLFLGCKETENDYYRNVTLCKGSTNTLTVYDSSGNVSHVKKIINSNAFSMNCLNGSRLPTFNNTSILGEKIDNALIRKKRFTLINFWFIECPPCIAEIPTLNKIVQEFSDVQILAYCRNDKSEVVSFLNQENILYNVVANADTIIEGTFKLPFGYPTSFLVDRKGKIIKTFMSLEEGTQGFVELMEIIKK